MMITDRVKSEPAGLISKFVLLLSILAIFAVPPGFAAKRVALVIGNDAYVTLPSLNNARKDATDVAAKLESLGFDVILKTNAENRDMARALAQFRTALSGADAGVVFFAGHGLQIDGANFVIPSDAQIEVEEDVPFEAINAERFLKTMKDAGAPTNVVILDACRDNPLPRSTRSLSRGLAVTEVSGGSKGVALLYSAGLGQVAMDGPRGGNGVFTGELLKVLEQPGLKMEEVFKQTARQVNRATNGRQTPFFNTSMFGDFYFNEKVVSVAKATTAPTDREISEAVEISFWESIKDSDDADLYQAYLSQYPNGNFSLLAEVKLAKSKQQKAEEAPVLTAAANSPKAVETEKAAVENPPIFGVLERITLEIDNPKFEAIGRAMYAESLLENDN